MSSRTVAIPAQMVRLLRDLTHLLVIGNDDALAADGRAGCISAAQLREAMGHDGPRRGVHVVDVPDEQLGSLKVLPIPVQPGTWAVDLDLWTAEEGQSQLTAEVTIYETPGGLRVELDGLHVRQSLSQGFASLR